MSFRALLRDLLDRLLAQDPNGPARGASPDDALAVLRSGDDDLMVLLDGASRVRRHFKGDRVRLCAILNARSGGCAQDCAFCAQSAHHRAAIDRHPMAGLDRVREAARAAEQAGACEFSLVTSGLGPGEPGEVEALAEAVRAVRATTGLEACVSAGIVPESGLDDLRAAGLNRFHHNLEAARSFYPEVCTTRDYAENERAVLAAKRAGLRVCCGGIFGMGETPGQRVELLQALAALDVDSVPVNFLQPIPGTPLADRPLLAPLDGLRILAAARMTLPAKDVIVCGGREATLRDFQGLVFHAGASGLLVGDYLTTKGRPAADDLRLVRDLGLRVDAR